MKKRYAIVEVGKDGNCLEEFICSGNCNKCDYGDTKEQFEKKVAQAIFRKINKFGDKWRNKIWTETDKIYSYKLAKEIVEFLGVE